MNLQAGLHAVRQTQNEDESNEAAPKSDNVATKDGKYSGRNQEKRECPAFGQACRKCGIKNHFAAKCQWLPCKIKIDSIWAQPKQLKTKFMKPNGDVQFLMDTGAECNVLPLTVYQKVTGDMDLKKLDKNKHSVLILANWTPRRLPTALINQVQEKLDEMVKDGIIAKVHQPTGWVSSMLGVRKPTTGPDGKVDIRICLDPKDLTSAIKRGHFPMPTIDEVATRSNGAKISSVFDASNGFWQVELDQASSLLTTFNTPFGRYCWKRMPFGINSAPEVWQRTMQEHIEGLYGVEVIADDFVVVGFGSTPEEWHFDHDHNVCAFLQHCWEKNLKLKKEKAQLRKTEVAFIGHILTPDGLK